VTVKTRTKLPKTKNGLIIPAGVIFYYVRDDVNKPLGCVALASNEDGCWCRGVSICSKDDQFSKVKARKLAYGRLCKAFGTGESSDEIRNTEGFADFIMAASLDRHRRQHKSGYDVMLSRYEQHLTVKCEKAKADKE